VVILASLLGLLAFQSWAYYHALPITLGPRVILEPWLLHRGFVMYESIVDIHAPLMPLLIATLATLIEDGLKLGKLLLAALLSLTTLLTFLVVWRKAGWLYGLWAAGVLVIWSPTFGFGFLWHESFLAPLYLLMFLAYDASTERRSTMSCLFTGFLGGVAILFKQHAILVLAAFVSWSLFTNWHLRRSRSLLLREIGLLVLAATLPVLAYAVYQYSQADSLGGLFYWTVAYPLTSDFKSLAAQLPTLRQMEMLASSCLLVPAAIYSVVDSKRSGDKTWMHAGLGLTLVVASSATAYPRFEFFHLQATLPLLASVSAFAVAYLLGRARPIRLAFMAIVVALSAFWLMTAGSAYRLIMAPPALQPVRQYSELVPLAREIRQYIGPADCIYIFAEVEGNSNLYYLLRCLPPKFWIFHYPWNMEPWMRNQVIASLAVNPPKWIAYFPNRWNAGHNAPDIMQYLQDHYQGTNFKSAVGDMQLLRRMP
jgi:hypothetical protein